jgi:ribonuclease E
VGRSPEELQKDFTNLTDLYDSIKRKASEIKGAGEIYRDSGLIIRTIRDYFSDDIDEVLVDSKEAYREAKDFFRDTMPACEKRVKLHKEKRPIFSRFQLEEQIDQIYEKRVALPSGGSLIIEPTEALVSIDVNSGKSSGERGIEDTAYKTNMEAAEEVARQLRLRDLGGLIVIDFIDMRENKHNHDVEKTLKQALKMDKARVNLGRISEFGIMEMSRQRIAKTLNDAIHLECPHCEGRGKVKSVEAMAVSFLRKVHAAAAKGTIAEVRGGLPLEVAYYLLNRKKRELTQIENDYEIEVTVKGKTSFLLNQLELDTVKREKPNLEDVIKSEAEAEEAHKPVVPTVPVPQLVVDEEKKEEAAAPVEGVKKRKRRKKKKKVVSDINQEATAPAQSETEGEHGDTLQGDGVDEVLESDEVAVSETGDDAAADQAVKHKKRKRRRSRSKANKIQDAPMEEAATTPTVELAVTEEAITVDAQPELVAAAVKPKRARPPRKKKATATVEVPAIEEPSVAEPAVVELTVEAPAIIEPVEETPVPVSAKPRRRAAAKKSTVEVVATPEPESAQPVVEEAQSKPAPKPRRKKKVEEAQ